MSADDSKLFEIAARVSDGQHVDWDIEEQSAATEQLREQIRHLRLVENVASLHQSATSDAMSSADPMSLSATVNLGELDSSAGQDSPSLTRWGRLEIREMLGEGGFGEVYRAWDANLDREVALKLIKPGIVRSDQRAEAVLAEGRMLARVRHPNVITVHGAETHDGRVGLWMELVRGRTLARLLREQGTFGAREAALIGIELCRALSAVHGAGLVHRDIKAENAMRDEGGRFLLMDFGAGQDLDDLRQRTARGISGTPLYIAPEIFKGGPATRRSDIYSLGVLLYHLVTGAYPVTGKSLAELTQAHRDRNERLLRDQRADLPEPYLQVIERALSHDPDRRFGTAGQLEHALNLSLGVEGLPDPSPETRPSRAAGWIAAAVLAVVALGLTGWITGLFDRTGESQAPVSSVRLPSASAYSVQAALYRMREGRREQVESGAPLQIGDMLSLEVRASKDLHVYIFNEDERGNSYALFPIPGLDSRNPLPAGQTHVLPGKRRGEQIHWQVDSAGDRERLIVLASPDPLPQFEQELRQLTLPGADAIAMAVPPEAKERLRGIGGLATDPKSETDGSTGRLFEMARRLAGQEEVVEGVWMREIELENPGN